MLSWTIFLPSPYVVMDYLPSVPVCCHGLSSFRPRMLSWTIFPPSPYVVMDRTKLRFKFGAIAQGHTNTVTRKRVVFNDEPLQPHPTAATNLKHTEVKNCCKRSNVQRSQRGVTSRWPRKMTSFITDNSVLSFQYGCNSKGSSDFSFGNPMVMTCFRWLYSASWRPLSRTETMWPSERMSSPDSASSHASRNSTLWQCSISFSPLKSSGLGSSTGRRDRQSTTLWLTPAHHTAVRSVWCQLLLHSHNTGCGQVIERFGVDNRYQGPMVYDEFEIWSCKK